MYSFVFPLIKRWFSGGRSSNPCIAIYRQHDCLSCSPRHCRSAHHVMSALGSNGTPEHGICHALIRHMYSWAIPNHPKNACTFAISREKHHRILGYSSEGHKILTESFLPPVWGCSGWVRIKSSAQIGCQDPSHLGTQQDI